MFDVADKKFRVFTRNVKTGEIGLTISETWKPKVIDEPMFIQYGDDFGVNDLKRVHVVGDPISYYKKVISYFENKFSYVSVDLKNDIQDDADDPYAIIAYNELEEAYFHGQLSSDDYIDQIYDEFGDAGILGVSIIADKQSESDNETFNISFRMGSIYIIGQNLESSVALTLDMVSQILDIEFEDL